MHAIAASYRPSYAATRQVSGVDKDQTHVRLTEINSAFARAAILPE
jgi:hypothetical protein